MKERGILFRGRLVRRILDDVTPKTQTRRILSPQPDHLQYHEYKGEVLYDAEHRLWWWKQHWFENLIDFNDGRAELAKLCPIAQPGDRLWVREAWRTVESLDELRPVQLAERVPIRYEADGTVRGKLREPVGRYRHARFMPRWASRLMLEVTGVRVERLQALTEEDAKAEGVEPHVTTRKAYPSKLAADVEHRSYVESFVALWDEINGDLSFLSNPWVWVVEFRRVEAQERAA